MKGERGGILGNAKEALRAEDAVGKPLEKSLEAVGIDRSLPSERDTQKPVFMGMPAGRPAFVTWFAVGGVEMRPPDAENKCERHLAGDGLQDSGVGIQRLDLGAHRIRCFFIHQIAFVQEDTVGVADLVAGSGVVETIGSEMCRIGDGENGIEPQTLAEFRTGESHCHRHGIGDAGRLDHEVIELLFAGEKLVQRGD